MPEKYAISSDAEAGREWLVDAAGCNRRRLADLELLQRLLESIIADLGLHPLGAGVWHRFPDPGGVTGIYLLSESHLTCHTWPEWGTASFNLFSCRPRPDWPWEEQLRELLQAKRIEVRTIERNRRTEAER